MYLKKKAQSLTELGVLLSLVIAATIGMQVYVKRGLQAKYKSAVDAAGDALTRTVIDDNGTPDDLDDDITKVYKLHQYEPYYESSDYQLTQDQDVRRGQSPSEFTVAGAVDKKLVPTEVSQREGYQRLGVNEASDDDWNW